MCENNSPGYRSLDHSRFLTFRFLREAAPQLAGWGARLLTSAVQMYSNISQPLEHNCIVLPLILYTGSIQINITHAAMTTMQLLRSNICISRVRIWMKEEHNLDYSFNIIDFRILLTLLDMGGGAPGAPLKSAQNDEYLRMANITRPFPGV